MKVKGMDTVEYVPDYSMSKEDDERIFNEKYKRFDEKESVNKQEPKK